MTTYTLKRDEESSSEKRRSFVEKIAKHWFQILVCLFILHIVFNKNVNIHVNLSDKNYETEEALLPEKLPASLGMNMVNAPLASPASLKSGSRVKTHVATNDKWQPSDFRNLSFVLSPTLAKRKGVSPKIVDIKLENCRKYVERFAAVAISEQKKFGIPASITLAQGLLETDAGSSDLAKSSNNHFGIKCRPQCQGCTCRNYADDDIYDMFRVFDTSWASFREHSLLLNKGRYKHLLTLDGKDYKGWAVGLKKAGYATDKQYAQKLIQIIEILDLYQFDA